MARGAKTGDEVTATAMAALLTGQEVGAVARQYRLPKAAVARLQAEMPAAPVAAGAESFDELFTRLLVANLRALTAIAEMVAHEEYITKQPANELAVLTGVITDKTVRLFEAAAQSELAAAGGPA